MNERAPGIGRKAAAAGLAAAGGWLAWSALLVRHDLPLPLPVPGEPHESNRRAGRLTYYVAGEGPPLLLIHSINAAGSAYEVRPIFDRMVPGRRVYAVDLPGFGLSDRSDRDYTIRLYCDAVHDMLDVIASEHGPAPIDALAISLASEFLARAAVERPGALRRLILVTPTGFSKASVGREGAPESSLEIPGVHGIVSVPIWSQALYDLLVSRPSIRYFLQRTYGSREIDEDLLAYDYLTAHQPGARHAPLAFLAGRLFSADIRAVYERLTMPIWVPHATRGDFRDFTGAGWAVARPNWRFEPFPTGALPHFEVPDLFMAGLTRFLGQGEVPAAVRS